MKNNLLIVESPSKATTIAKYLDSTFSVISSYGHVRALPSKKGAVLTDKNFEMHYEIIEKSKKNLDQIFKLAKNAENIYFATDPDREGEAISWHLHQILLEKGLKTKSFYRIVFHEVTKRAVLNALENSRQIDDNLVHAQRSRQALDYLMGFSLSELLWHKIPKAKSAGRVQSVALRLVCELEKNRIEFNSQKYWQVKADFSLNNKFSTEFSLVKINQENLDKFHFKNSKDVEKVVDKIKNQSKFLIVDVNKSSRSGSPNPPLITSTLQQVCINELKMRAGQVMRIAQQLYEGIKIENEEHVGLITYMRTDSISMSKPFAEEIRKFVIQKYGSEYVPSALRTYKSSVRNAQEAHECIRPTHLNYSPEFLEKYLSKEQLSVYKVIWKYSIMSQMANSITEKIGVLVETADNKFTFRSSFSLLRFDGFLKIMNKKANQEESLFLSASKVDSKSPVNMKDISFSEHETEPPGRYSEASLVKTMEEVGIGRPSTYASLIEILIDRGYVILEKRYFIPTDQGNVTNAFLVNFFEKYVNVDFTSKIETSLDEIAKGKEDYKDFLSDFWFPFSEKISEVEKIDRSQVLEQVSGFLHNMIFFERSDVCDKCKNGKLSIKFGKFGPFIGCANYPECRNIISLGSHKATQKIVEHENYSISLHDGKYGPYLEEVDNKVVKKRISVFKEILDKLSPENVERIVQTFPRKLNYLDKEMIISLGSRHAYVKYDDKYGKLDFEQSFEISPGDAYQIIKDTKPSPKAKAFSKTKAKPIKKKAS